MYVWIELIGTTLFGGTETMITTTDKLNGMTHCEYFNAHSEYYCPTVKCRVCEEFYDKRW